MRIRTPAVILLVLALGPPVRGGASGGPPPGLRNVARGRPYRLSPAPNYPYSKDPGDRTQLTDGVYTEGYFWTRKTTVGWMRAQPVTITVDLGSVLPIRGVSYDTAAGTSGVTFPDLVELFVSDDGEQWRYLGNLVALSAGHGEPDPGRYSVHRYWTDELAARGRYVMFLVPLSGGAYTFADEVEVYRGADRLLSGPPPGRKVESPLAWFAASRVSMLMKRRLSRDLATISAGLGEPEPALAKEIDGLDAGAGPDFRAVLPINDLHRRIFALQAKVWRKTGFTGLVAWQKPHWDMLSPTEPPQKGGASVDVKMMRGEYRSAAFEVSNATDLDADVHLSLTGLPAGAVTVRESPFTDTRSGIPVAAALPLAPRDGDGFRIRVHAGMTKQVWLTFDSRGVAPGDYRGQIALSDGAGEIPVRLEVYAVDFPSRPTLHLGGWDYTDTDSSYGVTPENRDAFLAELRDHFVDTPWATRAVMPIGSKDATRLEQWIRRWPDARRYFVFVSLSPDSFGAAMGSEAWKRAVRDWIVHWTGEFGRLGVPTNRIGLLLVDEPHSAAQDETIVSYAKAIHSARPDLLIFEDPTWTDPSKATPELYAVSDILCPNLPMWIGQGADFAGFYERQRDAGRRLWFYSCSGPGKLLDPYSYDRMQAWFCFRYGAEGMGYWAFGDTNGASSWNEYLAKIGSYTPLFLDDATVTAGKHMEAIREGVEDYEYLRMLRDRVAVLSKRGFKGADLAVAKELLATAAERVTGVMTDPERIRWVVPKDRTVADTVRGQVLEVLSRLPAE